MVHTLGTPLRIRSSRLDGTTEAVATYPEHAIGGDHLVRILDQVCSSRGYPKIIRPDNAKEFTGWAMLTWARARREA